MPNNSHIAFLRVPGGSTNRSARRIVVSLYGITTMSVCSSISSSSSSSCSRRMSLSNADSSARHLQPYRRSRPGIQRSDHTSASVQLELDDSRHSIKSFATGASTYFPNLVRKESVCSFSSNLCQSRMYSMKNIVEPLSISKQGEPTKPRVWRKTVVRFAPPSETLWIPIPSLTELSLPEVEATWYSSKEYDEQRIHDSNIVYLMEQELEHSSVTTLGAVVKAIEGSRGLEQRTAYGAKKCKSHRQNSIQVVLKQQEELCKERSFLIEYNEWNTQKEKQFEQRLAFAYIKQTVSAIQDAIKRAKFDAKQAASVASSYIASAKNKYSSLRQDAPLKPLTESIHSLSPQRISRQSPKKRCKDRPSPPKRDISTSQYPSIPSLVYDSLSSSTNASLF